MGEEKIKYRELNASEHSQNRIKQTVYVRPLHRDCSLIMMVAFTSVFYTVISS
jgi:hypothetical protein